MKETEKVPFDSMPPLIRGSFLTKEQEEKLNKPFKDVVLVVRCKDCKHGQDEEWGNGEYVDKTVYCDEYGIHKPDWFCADGVRKEQE